MVFRLSIHLFAQQKAAPTLGSLDGVVRDEQGLARPATVTVILHVTKQSLEAGADGGSFLDSCS